MITVAVLINGQPIYTRSARNMSKEKAGKTLYKTDAGDEIWHHRKRGAIPLAIQMLESINPIVDE